MGLTTISKHSCILGRSAVAVLVSSAPLSLHSPGRSPAFRAYSCGCPGASVSRTHLSCYYELMRRARSLMFDDSASIESECHRHLHYPFLQQTAVRHQLAIAASRMVVRQPRTRASFYLPPCTTGASQALHHLVIPSRY